MTGPTSKTAYSFGREYAEWMRANEPDCDGPVDIDEMCGGTVDIPDGDYAAMIAQGIEPSARQYWAGFNSCFE